LTKFVLQNIKHFAALTTVFPWSMGLMQYILRWWGYIEDRQGRGDREPYRGEKVIEETEGRT
jgi:hypothetical protein